VTPAELIKHLEAANEGSRQLDALIREGVLDGAGRDDPCGWGSEPLGPGAVAELEAPSCAQRYTTSIDAALTLVPQGWIWQVRVLYRGGRPTPINRAVVANDRTGMVLAGEYCEAEASTPALALCIAALRAHAAKRLGAGER
jgi:hypothetical protein